MAGNIWEWCLEKWNYKTDDIGSTAVDVENNPRVLRGGSWDFDPDNLRSAARFGYGPVFRDLNLGFRLVCRPPSSTDH
jgi:formylglycine-generating enzyme required for sulfatase activity